MRGGVEDEKRSKGVDGVGSPTIRKTRRTVVSIILMFLVVSLAYDLLDVTSGNSEGFLKEGCTCHSSNPDETVNMTLFLPEGGYRENETYELIINVTWNDFEKGGFYLKVSGGILKSLDDNVVVEEDGLEATHSSKGSEHRSWKLSWTASDDNETTFTLSGTSVDDDGTEDGDAWNLLEFTMNMTGEVDIITPDPSSTFPEYPYNLLLVSLIVVLIVVSILVLRPVKEEQQGEDKS
jgi:hypothetical protein